MPDRPTPERVARRVHVQAIFAEELTPRPAVRIEHRLKNIDELRLAPAQRDSLLDEHVRLLDLRGIPKPRSGNSPRAGGEGFALHQELRDRETEKVPRDYEGGVRGRV